MNRSGRPLAMPVEARRQEIFDAAEQLFGQRGYAQVSMADVAATAGMSKKTLYVHFSDKPGLLRALVDSSYAWPRRHDDEAPADPVAALEHRLRLVARHVLSERHLRLCRLAIGESMGIDGLARTFHERGFKASRRTLVAAVRAIPDGRCVLALPATTLADMLFGASIARPYLNALLGAAPPRLGAVDSAISASISALYPAPA